MKNTRTNAKNKRNNPVKIVVLIAIILFAVAFILWNRIEANKSRPKMAPDVQSRVAGLKAQKERMSKFKKEDGLIHCPVCDEGFKYPRPFNEHLSAKHPDYVESSTKE